MTTNRNNGWDNFEDYIGGLKKTAKAYKRFVEAPARAFSGIGSGEGYIPVLTDELGGSLSDAWEGVNQEWGAGMDVLFGEDDYSKAPTEESGVFGGGKSRGRGSSGGWGPGSEKSGSGGGGVPTEESNLWGKPLGKPRLSFDVGNPKEKGSTPNGTDQISPGEEVERNPYLATERNPYLGKGGGVSVAGRIKGGDADSMILQSSYTGLKKALEGRKSKGDLDSVDALKKRYQYLMEGKPEFKKKISSGKEQYQQERATIEKIEGGEVDSEILKSSYTGLKKAFDRLRSKGSEDTFTALNERFRHFIDTDPDFKKRIISGKEQYQQQQQQPQEQQPQERAEGHGGESFRDYRKRQGLDDIKRRRAGYELSTGSAILDNVKRLHAKSTGRTQPQTSGRPQTLGGKQQQYIDAKRRNQAEAERIRREQTEYDRRMDRYDRDSQQEQTEYDRRMDQYDRRSKQEKTEYDQEMDQINLDFQREQQAFRNTFKKKEFELELTKYRKAGEAGENALMERFVDNPFLTSTYLYSTEDPDDTKSADTVSTLASRNRILERGVEEGIEETGSTLEEMKRELAENKLELSKYAAGAANVAMN